jgi:4-hydroxybenzoyl-CoA reductase subunit beta
MLRLPPFRYLAPRTVEQALQLLAQEGEQAMPVAGGTDLYPNMKRRQLTPPVLVGLRGIATLKGITGSAEKGMRIGAGVTLAAVAGHPLLQQYYTAVATAAASVSTPQLRNMGTLGGNLLLDTRCNYYNQTEFWRQSIGYCMKKDGDICLVAPGSPRCWAISSADTAPALLSLGAQVRLVSRRGERVLPVRELFRDDGLAPYTRAWDELLTEILLPPADNWRSVYLKLRRRGSFDFPLLGVAAALRLHADGTVARARLTLGAVASHPLEADEAAAHLCAQPLSLELIDSVAQAAARRAKPLDNADLTMTYRKQVTAVFVRRAIQQLLADHLPTAGG